MCIQINANVYIHIITCVYIYMCVYNRVLSIRAFAHVYIHSYVRYIGDSGYTYIHTYIHIYIYTYTYIYLSIYLYIYVYLCVYELWKKL